MPAESSTIQRPMYSTEARVMTSTVPAKAKMGFSQSVGEWSVYHDEAQPLCAAALLGPGRLRS